MKDRIWYYFLDVKYKSIYLDKIHCIAKSQDRKMQLAVAFGTSGSIAVWAIWEKIPIIWAAIVALAQFTEILRAYIPNVKNIKTLSNACEKYNLLALEAKFLYDDYIRGSIEDTEAQGKLRELEIKENDVNNNLNETDIKDLKEPAKEAHRDLGIFLHTHYQINHNFDIDHYYK